MRLEKEKVRAASQPASQLLPLMFAIAITKTKG